MFRGSRTLCAVIVLAAAMTGVGLANGTPAWAWYGTLNVQKDVVLEPGATIPPGTTFTVVVSCTLNGESTGHWSLVFDSSGALVPVRSETSLPLGNIPEGSTCSAVETATGGANNVVVSPDVVIAQDRTDLLTVTNTFATPTTPPSPGQVEVSPETVTRATAPVATAVQVSPAFTG